MDIDREKIVVMRIKRKATEPPLSALVISDALGDSRSSTGFSTPKKRRDISGRARGVFRLADTVPDSWVGKGQEGEVLRERIRSLMRRKEEHGEGALSQGEQEELRTLGSGMAADDAQAGQGDGGGGLGRAVKGNRRVDDGSEAAGAPPISLPASIIGQTAEQPVQTAGPSTPPLRKNSAFGPTQYRVVPPPRAQKQNGMPPRLLNHAELEEAARSHFRFVDAQAVQSAQAQQHARPTAADAEADPKMAAFEAMLSEYLKLDEAKQEEEDEYVYDLYYRDLQELGVGAAPDVGALLGYDDLSPPSTPSDSEPEDEADEDSNDEDYYRNDYPEDEDADEDMEGYEDAFADEDDADYHSDDGGSGSDEREPGMWDYR